MTNFTDTQLERMKIPPHSIEAEQSVLGSLMMDNSCYEIIGDMLDRYDFYRADHGKIFQIIECLSQNNQPFDVITVADYIENEGNLEAVGGRAYLAGLAIDTPTVANIKAYAKIVRERSVLRQLIHAGNDIANSSFTPQGRDSQDLIDEAERLISGIARQSTADKGAISAKEVLIATIDKLEKLSLSKGGITGAATHWEWFDKKTQGLKKGDMIVVAGRPSMGKTTFALNMVERVAKSTKKPCLIFSLEMPSEQLMYKLLASQGSIDLTEINSGKIKDENCKNFVKAGAAISELPILFEDASSLTPIKLKSMARRAVRDHGELGMIMIDYLQIMNSPGFEGMRVNEITDISRSIKSLARELNVPIVVLAQLNRSLETRPNKRPIMSDLRDSGAIEQDADLICFLYRDEVYNPDNTDNTGIAEVIIAKQRNGPIGTVKLAFQAKYSRFVDLSPDMLDLYD